MHSRVRVDGVVAAALAGLVFGMAAQALGQNRLSRSIDGPVTADRVERALVLVPETHQRTEPRRRRSASVCASSSNWIPQR